MELLQRIRRRPRQEAKFTQTLLDEEMLGSTERPSSRSVHVRIMQHQLLGRGLLQEEKLKDPQQRRRGGGQDNEEEVEFVDAWRRRVQPCRPAGHGLRHDHGVRRRPGPDLLEAVQTLDLLLAVA